MRGRSTEIAELQRSAAGGKEILAEDTRGTLLDAGKPPEPRSQHPSGDGDRVAGIARGTAPRGSEPLAEKGAILGLTGLRGIAALMVFVYHARWKAGNPELSIGGLDVRALLENCDTGVTIFFVLSGFLLSLPFWTAIQRRQPLPGLKSYLGRRFRRILPAYFAILVAGYIGLTYTYSFYGFLDLALHVLCLHTFADYAYNSVNPVLWSIGIEFQFYLLLPLVMAGLAHVWRRFGGVGCLFTLIAISFLSHYAGISLTHAIQPYVPARFINPDGSALAEGTILGYLKFFAVGMACGMAYSLMRNRAVVDSNPSTAATVAWWALFCASAAGTCFLLVEGHEGGWRTLSTLGWPLNAVIFGGMVLSVAACPSVGRMFSGRVLLLTGEISYGIYLWHWSIQSALFHGTLPNHLHGSWLLLVGGAASLIITVIVAALSYYYLERPALAVKTANGTR